MLADVSAFTTTVNRSRPSAARMADYHQCSPPIHPDRRLASFLPFPSSVFSVRFAILIKNAAPDTDPY